MSTLPLKALTPSPEIPHADYFLAIRCVNKRENARTHVAFLVVRSPVCLAVRVVVWARAHAPVREVCQLVDVEPVLAGA